MTALLTDLDYEVLVVETVRCAGVGGEAEAERPSAEFGVVV